MTDMNRARLSIVVVPSSKSQVTVNPPFAPLSKGGWGDRNVAQIVQNGIT